jgi:hypothetical protein
MLTRKSAEHVRTVARVWLGAIGWYRHTLNGGLCAEGGHGTESSDHEVLEDLVLGLTASVAVLLEVGNVSGVLVVAGTAERAGVALSSGGAGTGIADLEGGGRGADGGGTSALASQRGYRRD